MAKQPAKAKASKTNSRVKISKGIGMPRAMWDEVEAFRQWMSEKNQIELTLAQAAAGLVKRGLGVWNQEKSPQTSA